MSLQFSNLTSHKYMTEQIQTTVQDFGTLLIIKTIFQGDSDCTEFFFPLHQLLLQLLEF